MFTAIVYLNGLKSVGTVFTLALALSGLLLFETWDVDAGFDLLENKPGVCVGVNGAEILICCWGG